jgi:hypothetical protein
VFRIQHEAPLRSDSPACGRAVRGSDRDSAQRNSPEAMNDANKELLTEAHIAFAMPSSLLSRRDSKGSGVTLPVETPEPFGVEVPWPDVRDKEWAKHLIAFADAGRKAAAISCSGPERRVDARSPRAGPFGAATTCPAAALACRCPRSRPLGA